MGLFSKKTPCPICGDRISWFLPAKIEDEYICSTCYNKIDIESDKASSLTMQGLRDYLVFYEQNQLLKDQFVISERIDLGLWDTKIIFDYQHKRFCLSKIPDKTVFEGRQLKSFTIKEDRTPLYEGSAEGIRRYANTMPERAMAMAPQISQFLLNKQIARTLARLDDDEQTHSAPMPVLDLTEPFDAFHIELHLDHPYWTMIQCDMDGPRFDNTHPNISDYLHAYQGSIEELERLVAALTAVAFPGAPEQSVGLSAAQSVHIACAAPADPIAEIKKYKALMESGGISPREFDAKKRQLLGI